MGTRQLRVDKEALCPPGGMHRTNGLAGALCVHICAHMVKSSVRLAFNLKLVCLALPSKADTSSLLCFSYSSIEVFQRRKRKKVEIK